MHFNSSMVRLKALPAVTLNLCLDISIPVWCDWRTKRMDKSHPMTRISIPVWCDWRLYLMQLTSESCKISIPVWCDWRTYIPQRYKSASNISIPVWCDWRQDRKRLKRTGKRFQFQYGAIEGVGLPYEVVVYPDFNSSMVRLKVIVSFHNLIFFNISIPVWCDWRFVICNRKTTTAVISIPVWCDWRLHKPQVWNVHHLISIPVWCDWRRVIFTVKQLQSPISIPVWCDWRPAFPRMTSLVHNISIPVWCDWRSVDISSGKKRRKDFNSSMVRLKASEEMIFVNYLSYFNSSMVRLKEFNWYEKRLLCYLFQFQYGAIEGIFRIHQSIAVCYFNSSMVRLKVQRRCFYMRSLLIFQFQYGAIEGVVWTPFRIFPIWFQFQYGAIEG